MPAGSGRWYACAPIGYTARALSALGVSVAGPVRMVPIVAACSVFGDRLPAPHSDWLRAWARDNAPGVELSRFFALCASLDELAALAGCTKQNAGRSLRLLVKCGALVKIHDKSRHEPPLYLLPPFPGFEGLESSETRETLYSGQGLESKETRETLYTDQNQSKSKGGFRVKRETLPPGAMRSVLTINSNTVPSVNVAVTERPRCPLCGRSEGLEVVAGGLAVCPDCVAAFEIPP